MENKPIINIRGIDCNPEVEEKFNAWYNETHIPMLLNFKGLRSAARYRRIGDDEQFPGYLAIYEFDDAKDFEEYNRSPELEAVREEMKVSWPTEPKGYESKWRVQYELIKSWGK
ncbi:DUF4286 family protein [Chloroflexota bacterium]